MPDERQVVVSNTTPLIALSLVDQLPILQELYREVLIPPAVHAEVLRGGGRTGAAELRASAWIRVVDLRDPGRADMLSDLDRGEAEVIALAWNPMRGQPSSMRSWHDGMQKGWAFL